jgi:hypothetical protein
MRYNAVMASPTTTFRLSSADRRVLDQLADELVCSRTDVLRLGMAALQGDPRLRRHIRAENVARAFLKSLRTQYGDDAVLELVDGPDAPEWKLAGEPIDRTVIDVHVDRVGDRRVMSLLDPVSGVGISNVMRWTDADGAHHAVISLDRLWVQSRTDLVAEPKTRQLYDGRTVVQIAEDDGTLKHIVLDHEGNAHLLDPGEVPAAAFTH